MRSVLVTGASSQIGLFLLPRLVEAGFSVVAASREPNTAADSPQVSWIKLDLACDADFREVGDVEGAIHIAPLWLLPPILPRLAEHGVKRVIAFGSTSVFVKTNSTSAAERETAEKLTEAEKAVAEAAPRLGIRWTVFRPTLVYGAGIDRNVAAVAKTIRKFGFFAIVGEGRGLRQPVHADDLAKACAEAFDAPSAFDRAYNLCGGRTLAYRQMVCEIFDALGAPRRIITLPLFAARAILRGLALVPSFSQVTPDMADRMNRDLVFDFSDAVRDFGYVPRGFKFDADVAERR